MFAANPIAQEGKVTMSNQQANDLADDRYDLERLWTEHLNGEFVIKDVEATLETMVEDAYVNHMPVNTGGRGKDQLRRFYRHRFYPILAERFADDASQSRPGHEPDCRRASGTFTHMNPINWLLPNVAPTHRTVTIDFVVVIEFRDNKVACERIYWDHASMLRQVGLLAV
jgi:carboxymethylenebutenolidase